MWVASQHQNDVRCSFWQRRRSPRAGAAGAGSTGRAGGSRTCWVQAPMPNWGQYEPGLGLPPVKRGVGVKQSLKTPELRRRCSSSLEMFLQEEPDSGGPGRAFAAGTSGGRGGGGAPGPGMQGSLCSSWLCPSSHSLPHTGPRARLRGYSGLSFGYKCLHLPGIARCPSFRRQCTPLVSAPGPSASLGSCPTSDHSLYTSQLLWAPFSQQTLGSPEASQV